ncbi:MAG: alkaline phosphatase family protein [Actinomycetota bacterium]
MSRRLVVLELNEVPARVLYRAADHGCGHIARLLDEAAVHTTRMTETLPREPYPSQSWASLGTGAPWSEHGIWWYNDPKPAEHPFYWERAARAGHSVGLLNVLHSSPIEGRLDNARFRFVVPDVFASDNATIPAELSPFHDLCATMARANARTSHTGVGRGLHGALGPLTHIGLRPTTAARIAALVAGVSAGRLPRERLRLGLFLLHGDLFSHLMRRHDPDLAVLFTNHVASAMHRYWYAAFPGDFDERHYDDAWVARYGGEIDAAMSLVDRFLGRLIRWADGTGRTIAIASSMGQGASATLDTGRTHEAVVVDAARLLDALDVPGQPRIQAAMHPQLTLEFETTDDAERAAEILAPARFDTIAHAVDRRDRCVTLTEAPVVHHESQVRLDGANVAARHVGLDIRGVDDHSSGRHTRDGVLVIRGPGTTPGQGDDIDLRDVADHLLALLGIDHGQPAAATAASPGGNR